MEPHVTLHHFVHPAWFERLGGFTKAGAPPAARDACKQAAGSAG